MEEQIRVLLALWQDGIVTADDVVRWADQQIEHSKTSALPSWLIELSLHGPKACFKNPTVRLPQPVDLSFSDRFALRILSLNLQNRTEAEIFVRWAVQAAMGEDLEQPEVVLSYELDHLLNDCNRMDVAVEVLRNSLPSLQASLRTRAQRLLSSAA